MRSLLVTPVHSTTRVVRMLAKEFPELTPLVPRMLQELKALNHNAEYHETDELAQHHPRHVRVIRRVPGVSPDPDVLLV